jgi:hypothetical protein
VKHPNTSCPNTNTKYYPEKVEVIPEEMESGVEHQEVPKEYSAEKPVGRLKKWHRGQNLDIEQRKKSKEWTQGNCGSRKKLAAASRKMTHRTGVAQRKVHVIRKNQTKGNVVRRNPKGRTGEK